MSERTFDRETLLDLTVNVIPLGIILFFVAVFLLVRPWEFDPFVFVISMALLVVPFIALAFLTFVSGRAIAQDEGKQTPNRDSFEFEDDDSHSSADSTTGVTDDEAATESNGDDDGESDGH